jgi:hypothetical protein
MTPDTCGCGEPADFLIDQQRDGGIAVCREHVGILLIAECPEGCQVNIART